MSDEHTERVGTSPGLVRALFTLLSVAAAGLLIWIAQEISGALGEASTSDFWWAMLFLAAAGLVLGLAQLFGGWTKWGWPTLSPTVFLLGFLPTLIVGGWIVLANQPAGGWQESRTEGWAEDVGIDGLFSDLATFLPVIPLVIGLVLAFSFDTTGPRTRIITREAAVPEDVDDYRRAERRETTTTDVTPTGARTTDTADESTVAEDLRRRDERGETVTTRAREERVEVRDPDRRETV